MCLHWTGIIHSCIWNLSNLFQLVEKGLRDFCTITLQLTNWRFRETPPPPPPIFFFFFFFSRASSIYPGEARTKGQQQFKCCSCCLKCASVLHFCCWCLLRVFMLRWKSKEKGCKAALGETEKALEQGRTVKARLKVSSDLPKQITSDGYLSDVAVPSSSFSQL